MSTGINYLDEVWNPVTGCSGKGCKAHCWAREMVKRFPQIHGWDPDTEEGYVRGYSPLDFSKVNFHPDRLNKPLHWTKKRRIGVCFCGDLFDDQVPIDWIGEVWGIMMRSTHHTFFLLTKQTQGMIEWFKFAERLTNYPTVLPNVFLGVSITDEEDADRMLPELLRIPGKHWISMEPMFENINILKIHWESKIHWLVCGSESGPKRRPAPPEWFRSVRDQCKAAGVPLWIKQMEINGKVTGDVNLFPKDLRIRQWPQQNNSSELDFLERSKLWKSLTENSSF